jgi:hypothetical protein
MSTLSGQEAERTGQIQQGEDEDQAEQTSQRQKKLTPSSPLPHLFSILSGCALKNAALLQGECVGR